MNESSTVQLDNSWLKFLEAEFSKPYMQSLRSFLLAEKNNGKTVYPKGSEYFNALNTTPLDQVQVVILGQDPYHGADQAHGLCFSVRKRIKPPPSLLNIYKEICAEYQREDQPFQHGNLSGWAEQGVLLLNSVLTVEQGKAASHQGKGWEDFTDKVIEVINQQRQNCVFLLWGSYAQRKGEHIDRSRHLVLTSPHPSPLSAYRGFLGCGHFRQCNEYLEQQGCKPIDWFAI